MEWDGLCCGKCGCGDMLALSPERALFQGVGLGCATSSKLVYSTSDVTVVHLLCQKQWNGWEWSWVECGVAGAGVLYTNIGVR